MSRKKKEIDNFLLFKIFIILLGLIILLSIFLKFIKSFKESNFDNNYFNFLVFEKKQNLAYFFSLKGKEKNILEVKTKLENQEVEKQNKLGLSINLGFPVDAVIYLDKDENLEKNDFITFIFKRIFSNKQKLVGLNKIDLAKIYYTFLFSKISIYEEKIFDNFDWVDKINSLSADELKDKVLLNKDITVEIDNESGKNGFGFLISRFLKNTGFNVVNIITEDKNLNSKIVIRRNKDELATKLKRIFDLPVIFESRRTISDIQIVIGKN